MIQYSLHLPQLNGLLRNPYLQVITQYLVDASLNGTAQSLNAKQITEATFVPRRTITYALQLLSDNRFISMRLTTIKKVHDVNVNLPYIIGVASLLSELNAEIQSEWAENFSHGELKKYVDFDSTYQIGMEVINSTYQFGRLEEKDGPYLPNWLLKILPTKLVGSEDVLHTNLVGRDGYNVVLPTKLVGSESDFEEVHTNLVGTEEILPTKLVGKETCLHTKLVGSENSETDDIAPNGDYQIGKHPENVTTKLVSTPDFDEDAEEEFASFDPLEIVELKTPERERELLFRTQSTCPYFTKEEAESFLNNIDEAKKDSLKLFLYLLWEAAAEYVCEGYDCDGDEEEKYEVEITSPEGYTMSERTYKRVLKNSYEELYSAIANKELECADGSIILELDSCPSYNHLIKSVAWERVALDCSSMSYKISASRFRNINATTTPKPLQPASRQERKEVMRKARKIMAELYRMKSSDGLSRIEKIWWGIVQENFCPNPDAEGAKLMPFVYRDSNMLGRESWKMVQWELKKAGIKTDDFILSVLSSTGPNDGGQLLLQNPPFLPDGLVYVNSLYGDKNGLKYDF